MLGGREGVEGGRGGGAGLPFIAEVEEVAARRTARCAGARWACVVRVRAGMRREIGAAMARKMRCATQDARARAQEIARSRGIGGKERERRKKKGRKEKRKKKGKKRKKEK